MDLSIDITLPGNEIEAPLTIKEERLLIEIEKADPSEKMEFLFKIALKLKTKENLKLMTVLSGILDREKLSEFDKMEYHNKITNQN